jgi:two-component system, NtrC family, sensor kinase
MRRRSRAGGEPVKTPRKAVTAKRRNAPKSARRRSSSVASHETKVARLTRELDEALERQKATAEVLSAISRSKFELQPILQSVVDTASQLCRADVSVIFRLDGGVYRFAAGYSLVPAYIEHERQTPISPGPGTLIGRAALSRQVVQIEDAWTDPLYEQKAAAKIAGGRSMMGVPLMREGEPIGVIGLSRSRVDPFAQREIDLVTTFADQAVIAIENARLFEAEQQRTRELTESLEQQTATSEVLQVISRSPFDLQTVLDTLVQSASRLCEVEIVNIWRPKGGVYRLAASNQSKLYYENKDYLETIAIEPNRGTVTGRTILDGKTVHVHDVQADPDYNLNFAVAVAPLFNELHGGGFRTVLGVPLLSQGVPIGVIALTRSRVRPFTEKQIELIETFADQAVIAIENVRLFEAEQQRTRELTESLEQQTATSEVLKVISSSPGELEPVFQAMLENAVRICEAKFGMMYRYDGTFFHAVAFFGVPLAYVDYLRREPIRPSLKNGLGRALQAKEPIHILDITAEQGYSEREPLRVATAELAGARTLVAVPMLKEHEFVGAIVIFRQEVRPFSDKQIALVTNFAAQAVIAIENTRLLNELRERTDALTEALGQQTATSDVLQVISSSPGELEPVFKAMLENATRICDAKFGTLQLLEGDGFRAVALHNAPPAFADYVRRGLLRPGPNVPLSRMARTKQVVHIADITMEKAYIERDPLVVAGADLGGYRTILVVPMLKESELLGGFVIFRQEVRLFTDKQIELVQNFAAQAVIAIENARLLSELRESLEQQTATADVLKVISRSAFDLKTVLDTLVEAAA